MHCHVVRRPKSAKAMRCLIVRRPKWERVGWPRTYRYVRANALRCIALWRDFARRAIATPK